jgi:hypothetical protein
VAQEPADTTISNIISRLEAGQETPEAGPALRVFLDCQAPYCDFDHFRREILFVDWVRDRQDADLHLLITSQTTGGGGSEITIQIIGRRQFEGGEDRLTYTSDRTDTQQEGRAGLTQTLKLGLVRYLAGTDRAGWVQLFYTPPGGLAAEADREDDPWNLWVFSVGLNGNLDGQSSTKSVSLDGNIGANRTDENWKVSLGVNGSYRRDEFELSDSTTLTSTSRSYGGRLLIVGSISDHWSAGVRANVSTSTFFNQDLTIRGGPALEYNIFPYAESTERQLRFLYSVTVNSFDYTEETIFQKTEETLLQQNLSVSLDLLQPWGSATFELGGSTFLNDLSENRVSLFVTSDWRVFRGLSFNVFGSVAHIADQRALPSGGVTDEEILLRRRELATTFQYFVSLGLSFTFGSKFANVVNPRFGG